MVVIPVDLQDREALSALMSAALRIGDCERVHLVHIMPAPSTAGRGVMRRDPQQMSRLRLELAKLAVQSGLGRAHVEVRYGLSATADEIARYATIAGASRIIVPSHQRAGVAKWLQGSIAEAVQRRATMPVDIVPRVDPPAPAPRPMLVA